MKIEPHKKIHNEKNIVKEITSLRSIRMSEKERTDVWKSIVSRMPVVSPFAQHVITLRSMLSFGTRLVAMVLVLVLGLGSGLTYASEESLPGDFLYPFKVHVSEEIESLSKKDPEERASFATQRAERRLAEVKILVTEGSFDEIKSQEVVANFEKHTKKAKEETQKLSKVRPEKALIVASNFETTLQTNSIILDELKKDTGATEILEQVVSQVKEEKDIASEEKSRIMAHVFYDDSIDEEVRNTVIEEKIEQVESQLALLAESEPVIIVFENEVIAEKIDFQDPVQISRELAKEGKLDEAFTLLHETHYELEKNRVLANLEQEREEIKLALEIESGLSVSDVVEPSVVPNVDVMSAATMMTTTNVDPAVSPDGLWKVIIQETKNDDESYKISYSVMSTLDDSIQYLMFSRKTIGESISSTPPIYIWSSDNAHIAYEKNNKIVILQLLNGEIQTTLDGSLIASVEPFQAWFDINTKQLHYFVQKDGMSVLATHSLFTSESISQPITIEPIQKELIKIEDSLLIKEKVTR
jgi:hypothetical protein